MCLRAIRARRLSIRRRGAWLRLSRSRCVAPDNRFSLVKIYTKTGDAGETGLFGGGRVSKDDPRVQAYGDVDELNAWIGFVVAIHLPTFESNVLQTIQRDLFAIGAELATPDPAKLRASLDPATVTALETV